MGCFHRYEAQWYSVTCLVILWVCTVCVVMDGDRTLRIVFDNMHRIPAEMKQHDIVESCYCVVSEPDGPLPCYNYMLSFCAKHAHDIHLAANDQGATSTNLELEYKKTQQEHLNRSKQFITKAIVMVLIPWVVATFGIVLVLLATRRNPYVSDVVFCRDSVQSFQLVDHELVVQVEGEQQPT